MTFIPKNSIVLIEDIDCAFLPREELYSPHRSPFQTINPNCRVTLSGLLNILDGVGSEDGKIFFATTNHIDRLDAALLRPGRIDKKVQYKLATRKQALALFERFFPHSRFGHLMANGHDNHDKLCSSQLQLSQLGEEFVSGVPEYEFSTAQLQGYLLTYKMQPRDAASGIQEWVESERTAAREREAEAEAKRKLMAAAATKKLEQTPVTPDFVHTQIRCMSDIGVS